MTAQEIRARVPELEARLDLAPGKSYGANVPIAPRVLTQLGVEGALVRGENAGHWRLSKPRWTLDVRLARRRTAGGEGGRGVRRAGRPLAAHVRPRHRGRPRVVAGRDQGRRPGRAAPALGAVEVSLDGGGTGWVLPDDVDPEDDVEPWAALLPVLDPTVMGWKERDFYLGEHAPHLFDTNGNAGTTAWWDGRIVGCWVQDDAGVVEVRTAREAAPRPPSTALEVGGGAAHRLAGRRPGRHRLPFVAP